MPDEDKLVALEAALVARAQSLADSLLADGQEARIHLLAETRERLQQREAREMRSARAAADRRFRQRVQAGEMKLQEKLGSFQWLQIEAVLNDARRELRQIVTDAPRYTAILGALIRAGAEAIESERVAVELNARDRSLLHETWAGRTAALGSSNILSLSGVTHAAIGGAVLLSDDGSIRVDNTFEGRLERYREEIYAIVFRILFESVDA